jgi:hypothetical protein
MKPWLFAMFGSVRTSHTQTFTANATFTVPIAVGVINITGKGQNGIAGTPEYDDPPITKYRQFTLKTYTYARRDGGDPYITQTVTYGATSDSPGETTQTVENATIASGTYSAVTVVTVVLYEPISVPGAHHPAEAPTTGAAASGFGKTFPGGVGTNAATITYNNAPVTRGATYNIVVPSGGFITITYLQ